jgi:peptidoglycan hydrolase-like protein with peptidoglycan-binding domain
LHRIVIPVSVACAALAIGAWAAAPSPQTSSTTTKKKSAVKTTTKAVAKSTTKAAPKSVPATATKRTTASKGKRAVTARHYAPQQPSTERYKEIQEALAAKGYFKTEPNGAWGAASIDALKRFQHDQNLVEDGKIGSLSLIALGLGPKREPAEQPVKTVEPIP